MEVSMPTGSLCAERNVIGSALSDDITLRRRDLKLIAVYSATIPRRGNLTQTASASSSSSSISLEGCATVPSTAESTPTHVPRSPSFAQRRAIMQVRVSSTTTTTAGQVVQSSSSSSSSSTTFSMPRTSLQRSVSLGAAEAFTSTSRSSTQHPNLTSGSIHEADNNPGNRKRVYSHMDGPEGGGSRSKKMKNIAFSTLVPLEALSPPSPSTGGSSSLPHPVPVLASGSADEEAEDVFCQPVSTALLSGAAEVITIEIDEGYPPFTHDYLTYIHTYIIYTHT